MAEQTVFEKSGYDRVVKILGKLAVSPPQSLLLEGGSDEDRLQIGKYWAMLHNCPEATHGSPESVAPCFSCPVCRQIESGEWRDLLVFDGRISNRQDEEKPGLVRALRMENIRELKSVLAGSPQGAGKRVILIQGMGITREEAQNSLLKVLEEPPPHNLFGLLVSQRQQVLPTLASRSFCLSLPWNDSASRPDEALLPLLGELQGFLENGAGFLDKIGQKGQLDANIAAALVFELQKALVRAHVKAGDLRGLAGLFARFANQPEKLYTISRWLGESLEMLDPGVSPARVMEALSTRLFMLLKGN